MTGELQFGEPMLLWGLILAPVWLVLSTLFYFWRQKKLARFADSAVLGRLTPDFSPLRFFIRAVVFAVALFFLMLAAAQPKFGVKPVPVQRRGVDLIIALDVSKSMDANDISPSRLKHATYSIDTLLDKLAGDRIGLVAFAGEAVLVHPLTTRAAGFRITLDTLDTDSLPVPGTAIGRAIKAAREGFEQRSIKHKVLVIITDGETHDTDALVQARQAHEEGVVIYTLGIGTENGALIPERIVGGRQDYKKDEGKYVMSKLNAKLLQELAQESGGSFYRYTGSEDVLDRLYGKVAQMGQEEFAEQFKTMLNDIYQYPLLAAVLLIFFEMAVGARRWRKR